MNWTVETGHGDRYDVDTGRKEEIRTDLTIWDENGDQVCSVARECDGLENDEIYNAALRRASLMAAAPDMYEALEKARDAIWKSGYDPDDDSRLGKALNIIYEALEKADEREPGLIYE